MQGVHLLLLIAMVLGLAMCICLVAATALCDVLGGQWYIDTEACRDEFGGNGSNDPGSGPYPWT